MRKKKFSTPSHCSHLCVNFYFHFTWIISPLLLLAALFSRREYFLLKFAHLTLPPLALPFLLLPSWHSRWLKVNLLALSFLSPLSLVSQWLSSLRTLSTHSQYIYIYICFSLFSYIFGNFSHFILIFIFPSTPFAFLASSLTLASVCVASSFFTRSLSLHLSLACACLPGYNWKYRTLCFSLSLSLLCSPLTLQVGT